MALDKYTIGRRYAKALFELTAEQNTQEETYNELLALRQVFTDHSDLGDILTDTRLNLLEKKPILDSLKSQFSPVMQTFLQMVFDYKRMNDILFMVDYFEQMYDAKNKIILAKVTTAVALSETQTDNLSTKIAKKFDANQVKIQNIVDPDIIGGVIVNTADQVVDGSIKTRLMQIKTLLLNK